MLRDRLGFSERRACRLAGQHRSTQRHEPTLRGDELRWRVEHDYRELKQCLGLDHYVGRTFRGLHHHLTCVTVAHAFLTCCRLARAGHDAARPQTAAA